MYQTHQNTTARVNRAQINLTSYAVHSMVKVLVLQNGMVSSLLVVALLEAGICSWFYVVEICVNCVIL